MSRIATTFEQLKAQGRKALIPYVTAGFPFADITPALMYGMVDAGADVEPVPYEPVLRGMLLTGAEPHFLRRSVASTVPSTASDRPLWSPAAKLVGEHIGPYLARHQG